ncbi:MAG TPA: D-glycerate dehydrogenase [Solirubrobacteraceae bacterium]|jgi:glyoxylate reductase
MARCFVSRELPGSALERLRAHHEVEVWPQSIPPSPEQLRACVADCDGLISLLSDKVDERLMRETPTLRAIANYAVGVDNIDRDAARSRSIQVGNTPDVLTDSTADLAFALLLACARRLPEAQQTVRDGRWVTWEPAGLLGMELRERVLGVVGYGRIGRAVARRAEAFGMQVIHVRSDGVGLDELLARSDIVTLHCPLTPATDRLIDATRLAQMKPGAILINTARGQIVDQDALLHALQDGRLGAAGLDVADPEPLPADDPLLAAPNLIVLPHIGSATHTARERMAEMAVENLLAALAGKAMPYRAA